MPQEALHNNMTEANNQNIINLLTRPLPLVNTAKQVFFLNFEWILMYI